MNNLHNLFRIIVLSLSIIIVLFPVSARQQNTIEEEIDLIPFEEVTRMGNGTANDLAWSPDGEILAISGGLGIRFYNQEFNEIGFVETDTELRSLDWSPDGTMLATGNRNGILTSDGELSIWLVVDDGDNISLELQKTVDSFTAYITIVEWNATGSALAGVSENEVIVFDLTAEQEFVVYTGRISGYPYIGTISWHPENENVLAVATGLENVFVWSLGIYNVVQRLPESGSDFIYWLSADELVTSNESGGFHVYDFNTTTPLHEFLPEFYVAHLFDINLYDGQRIATFFSNDQYTFVDIDTGNQTGTLSDTDNSPKAVTWHPTQSYFLSVSWANHHVHVWNVGTGEIEVTLTDYNLDYRFVSLSPNGNYLIVNGSEVWDLSTNTLVTTIGSRVNTFSWSPDSTQIATIFIRSGEYGVNIWDAFSGELVSTTTTTDTVYGISMRSLQWYEENSITATSDTIIQWDLTTDEEPDNFDCHPWGDLSAVWSLDGNYIATSAWDSALLWICDNQFNRVVSFEAYRTVEWSPDSATLATVGIYNTLRVWRIPSGEPFTPNDGGENNILEIAWHEDQHYIITGHLNNELRLWQRGDYNYFRLVGNVFVSGLRDVIWAGDNLITSSDRGIIQVWQTEIEPWYLSD